MLPSLHSLATVAILKSPEASKQTFDTLSLATGHFKHLSVLFVFEGDLFRTFLKNFHTLQVTQQLQTMKDLFTYMKTFQEHFAVVSYVNPAETNVVRRFLNDFQIVITDVSYKRITFDVRPTQFEKDLILRTLNI